MAVDPDVRHLRYFFAGGGWNQNSQFDLTRAIVERHTFAIDAYAGNTRRRLVRERPRLLEQIAGAVVDRGDSVRGAARVRTRRAARIRAMPRC